MSSRQCIRLRTCEIEGRKKKLRAVIGTVICWRSRANTWSGHEAAHKFKSCMSQHRPTMVSGSCKKDAVWNSSAVLARQDEVEIF